MKLLLLSDIPPSRDFTAGIFLENFIGFFPKGSVASFIVLNQYLDPKVPDHLNWMPIVKVTKPSENTGVKRFGRILSLLIETYHRNIIIPKIANKVIEYANAFGAEAVLIPIQGQTMISLAREVGRKIRIPIYPLVYDPPGWWLRENKVHPWISNRVLQEFELVLRNGAKTSCCSWAMSEYYKERYQIKTIPIVASLDPRLARKPGDDPRNGAIFTICLAGQMYSANEWGALIAALNSVSWIVAGKNVKIKLLGPHINQYAEGHPMDIEFLGWRSQEQSIDIFAESDLLYCPYWFDPAYEQEARLSFPSKLTGYLASGRPIMFHGPPYSSPYRFLDLNNAAFLCDSLDPKEILSKLEEIITDRITYRSVSINARSTFDKFLTIDHMHESIKELLTD